jgi:hypothetical protein
MDFELGKKILKNISNIVVGKDDALELLLVALLANGMSCWKMSRVLTKL